ncbi:acetylcholine receptor subunit beta [Plakobranchus ocellatus]|uniref:Acetylcholine receptor subunit beta n=1 Tax=Plakobranchus ocellatus TaxID=259542 RepID=A0AAV3ZLK1_9GAST|nr:acetylcholine receptor subunit beta [Plakobranchus ocellatus]
MVKYSPESETTLINNLLTNYDNRVRWAPSLQITTHVSLGLSFRKLTQLDERQHFMESVSYMTTAWHDGRLMWDRTSYGGIDHVKVPASALWKPDIVPLTSSAPPNLRWPWDSSVLAQT